MVAGARRHRATDRQLHWPASAASAARLAACIAELMRARARRASCASQDSRAAARDGSIAASSSFVEGADSLDSSAQVVSRSYYLPREAYGRVQRTSRPLPARNQSAARILVLLRRAEATDAGAVRYGDRATLGSSARPLESVWVAGIALGDGTTSCRGDAAVPFEFAIAKRT